jgi:hypothetical protein
MSLVRCPTCNKPFDPQTSQAMPFCSDRCRQIDLNRWLKEEISIPLPHTDEGESPEGHGDEQSN